jgi:hypothetical protein
MDLTTYFPNTYNIRRKQHGARQYKESEIGKFGKTINCIMAFEKLKDWVYKHFPAYRIDLPIINKWYHIKTEFMAKRKTTILFKLLSSAGTGFYYLGEKSTKYFQWYKDSTYAKCQQSSTTLW